MEASGGLSVPGDGQVPALDSSGDEVGYDTAVVGAETRTVGVEDPYDADRCLELQTVCVGEGFGDSFAFVVACAGSEWVDVTPVCFGLRADL